MQLIDEFEALLSKYTTHSPPSNTQCEPRNVVCVAISNPDDPLNETGLDGDGVLRAIQYVFGDGVPVVPDVRNKADESDQIRQLLGNEFPVLVIDGRSNWPENVLGAACGAVKTPGLLILMLPNGLDASPGASPYEQHFKRGLRLYLTPCPDLPACFWLHPIRSHLPSTAKNPDRQATQSDIGSEAAPWKAEQSSVIRSVLDNTQYIGSSLDIILARRGRGKSAVLGQLINHLFDTAEGVAGPDITLTASHPNQVIPVTKHIVQSSIAFTPLDKVLQSSGIWLFVDEAGSVPVPILRQLTTQYEHIVMAGTVDGYEGSGRALQLMFTESESQKENLSSRTHHHTLNYPVRWPIGDQLETLCNDLLCLDTISDADTVSMSGEAKITHERVSSEQLLNNRALLNSVFGLLLQAHYQTSSRDLKHLLNQHRMSVFIQRMNGHVTGACLVAHEGELHSAELAGVKDNSRRPVHQRLPVLLYRQCHNESILQAIHWRVIRIAVHPALQQRGLGTRLLAYLKEASSDAINLYAPDVIGASFGATRYGLAFWQKCGYQPMHWGFRLNPRSGQRTITVSHATDPSGDSAACLDRANAHLLDTVQALEAIQRVRPEWITLLYGEPPPDAAPLTSFIPFSSDLALLAGRPVCDSSSQQHNDARRLELWRTGESSLHESWGPIVRRAGGASALATWKFPDATNVKQLTKHILERVT